MSHGAPSFESTSPLDASHQRRLAGDAEGAMRAALAVLDAAPSHLGAAEALALAVGANATTKLLVARFVEAHVRRGDLPAAASWALRARVFGCASAPLVASLARAFAHGAPRLAEDAAVLPPDLIPQGTTESPDAGPALLALAEAALLRFAASEDAVPGDRPLPVVPLFSALAPAAFEKLLSAMSVREHEAAMRVVAEGEDGREAFVVVRGSLEARRARPGAEPELLARLGPGSIFGEMALVSEAPRAASVFARTPVELLVAPRDALEALARVEPAVGRELGTFCRGRMVANLLRHGSILGSVEAADRAALVASFRTRTFAPGDTLVVEGEETQGLYLLASGSVAVDRTDADGDRLRIATLGPGDVVGEISLVLRRPASATVRALHPTVALELERDAFQSVARRHPKLLAELYAIASQRDDELRTVVAQRALDVDDAILL